jgi:hypothetical protein
MTLPPKNWYSIHQRVVDIHDRIFKTSFNNDTGGLWICADSGTSPYATECETLRAVVAAHQPGTLAGNSLAHDTIIRLRAMGRGGSLSIDTGSS